MKTVLISGASTGIGRECALDLSRAGWRVFAGVRKPEDGQSLQAESAGGITPLILDVTDAESIGRAAAQLETDLAGSGLDGLVNNAGIINSMPAQARQYYADELQLLSKLPQRMNKIAFSPKKVSRAVTHALTAGRPKIRYVVGAEARVMVAFNGLTPARMADWITGKIMAALSRYL